MCFSGKYTFEEIKLKIKGKGRLVTYIRISDIVAIKKYIKTGEFIEGVNPEFVTREKTKEVLPCYGISDIKRNRGNCAVLEGKVDGIVHVLRCFRDSDVVHVPGDVDPIRDIEVIELELIL